MNQTECREVEAMKKTNKCIKCGSDKLLRIPSMPGDASSIAVGEPMIRCVLVTRYVCGECGFIEHWIDSSEALKKLRDEYGAE
jgi:predicted nucleic-acid-binding Zn-ribbon protein